MEKVRDVFGLFDPATGNLAALQQSNRAAPALSLPTEGEAQGLRQLAIGGQVFTYDGSGRLITRVRNGITTSIEWTDPAAPIISNSTGAAPVRVTLSGGKFASSEYVSAPAPSPSPAPSPAPAPAPTTTRTAIIGDSLTAQLGYNLSPFQWINGTAARGAQMLVANAGVSGETVAQVLARVNNAATAPAPGLAGLAPLGVVYVRVGTNDARALTASAGLAATYASLLNAIKTYADRVVILSVPPIGASESNFAAKNALTLEYNATLQAFAAANAGFTFVNDSANLRDGSGAQLAGYFQADGIHNAGRATWKEGADASAALASLFAGWAYVSPLTTNPADVYPAQPQWVTNPTMQGTGGSMGSGWTGQVADGYSVGSNGGGINGTVAKVAADVGDTNATPWQRITPAQVTRTGAGESIRITTALAGRTITGIDPAALDVMAEVRFVGFDANYFSSLTAWVQGSGVNKLTEDIELKIGGEVLTQTVVMRHKLPRPSAGAESGATLFMDLVIAANRTGAMGSIDYRCVSVRG